MGTEKFIAFKEDGSAYRLKGRILRFLDNEPVSEADKTNIRSTLSVPASAEGLTPANNLSDLDSAATARTNLEVNSIDEDAQANALKTTAPALHFNGTSSVVTVADDDKLSFTDGTDDLPFSISAWIKPSSAGDGTTRGLLAKFGASAPNLEWAFYIDSSNRLNLSLRDSAGDFNGVYNSYDLSAHSDTWVHVACTYGGSGPNSSSPFASAHNEINLLVNGEALTSNIQNNSGTYNGMSNSSQAVWIGRRSSSDYFEGEVRNCKIFNRELTAAEVAELARGNDLGFADEFGGAFGGVGTIDETVGLSSWSGAGSATPTNLTETANTTVGGRPNVLQQQATATVGTATKIAITSVASVGKRVRIEFDYYINSGNATLDTIIVASPTSAIATLNTAGAWTRASVETVLTSTTVELQITDGASYNATALDFVGFDNFSITEIGTLASFSAERYDTSTNKLYDISDNAFVGTGTSVSLTGREVPVYETGTWTPSITFGGGSTGIGYSAQEGVYTRIGNTCFVAGVVTLSSVGSDTGTARLAGLPFLNHNMTATSYGSSSVVAFDMTGLTSVANLLNEDNQPNAILYDSGATGGTAVTNGNFTSTSSLRFSMTYQIQ